MTIRWSFDAIPGPPSTVPKLSNRPGRSVSWSVGQSVCVDWSADRAVGRSVSEDSNLKHPHPPIIHRDNRVDRWLVVGWTWGRRHQNTLYLV